MKPKKRLVLITLLVLFVFSIAKSQTTNFSFTNKPFSDPELPNYGRGAQYWNGTVWGTGAAPQVPPGNPTTGAKSIYNRYWWSDCEKSQGQYTFTKASLGGDFWKSIEYGLEWAANNGAMYTFGNIMTSWDGQGTIFYDGGWSVYPQYLHNLMQAEATTKDWKYSNGGIWVPNWNSPSYLARWRALQDTLKNYIENWKFTPSSGPWVGKQVLGKNILEYVDLRGFGNYGEWHTWPWGDDGSEPAFAKATDSTFKKIIDIGAEVWTNYPLHIPVGAFDDNPWGEGTAFTTWYVLTKKTNYGVIGWRRDNIGDVGIDEITLRNGFTGPNGWKADTAIVDRWKYAIITGEPLNGGGTCCPYYWHVRSELNNFHYASFGNGNYGSTAQSVFDSMQVYFKMSGYRYNLNGGSMTTTLTAGQSFNTTLNWRNVGVSPLYQKRWRIRYELKNSSDQVIQSWISRFKTYLFLPSSVDSVINETFSLNSNILPASTYKLTVKIEDTVGLLAPLFIAINSPTRNTDGSYTLRNNITVLAGSLPITFYSFSAAKKSNYVQLNWQTSCEQDNQKFEIERSSDGLNFFVISTVNPQYNCVSYTYSYRDYTYPSGNIFYRIKQTDFDGTVTYSSIAKVNTTNKNKTGLTAFPNPTTNEINLLINEPTLGETIIAIHSSDGKLVKQQVSQKIGEFYLTTLDIKNLNTGIYFVRAMVNNKIIGNEKFVKE